MLVDDFGIGKTFCSKILVKKMQNAFYIDASQSKPKRLFIKSLSREIGFNYPKVGYKDIFDHFASEFRGIVRDVKENRKAFYEKLFYDVAECRFGQ